MIRSSLLACLFSACAAHGESYTLVISPLFSDEYAANIEAAARDWEWLVPVSFHVEHDTCLDKERTTTCVFPVGADYFIKVHEEGKIGLTVCAGAVDDACWIMLDSGWRADQQQQLAGHELGHAMGLPHEGPGTSHPTTGPVIMAPRMGDAALRPTCLDAAAWYTIRGWVVPSACPDFSPSASDFD